MQEAMVDKALVARQTLASSLGLDGEHVEKRYGVLRPAGGNEWLAKLADDIEEAVPAAAGVLDFALGAKPRAEAHGAEWWGAVRPRPHRGKSADPSVADARTKKVLAEQAAAAATAAAGKAAAAAAAAASEEASTNEQQMKELAFATAETQKRRLGFFGRPVQKCRLSKMRKELERKSHERQAAMFAHLLSDAEAELDLQTGINKDSKAAKTKAAAVAAGHRAEETGARAAAAGLKPMGAALKGAMLQALAAADEFKKKAEEQEAIARKAKIAEEAAFELMQREAEKVRFCQGAIKAERAVAKRIFEEIASIEQYEILALCAEEQLLREFAAVWQEKIKKVPKGSPAYFMVVGQIDMYDLRLDVVAMERRMYIPTYLKPVDEPFSIREGVTPMALSYRPVKRDIDWIFRKQMAKDGLIGLAKAAVGPELKYRRKIVQSLNMKEHPDIDLPEEACDTLFEQKGGVSVRSDFLEDEFNPLLIFVNRQHWEENEKEKMTKMSKEIFEQLWAQDPRHEVKVNRQACSAKLRHRPDFVWCCQWIVSEPEVKKWILPNSYVLGPQKKPYTVLKAPALHADDKPGGRVCMHAIEI